MVFFSDIKEATIRKEQVESSKRWNELLKRELDQKTKKIHFWDTLIKSYQNSESKCADLEVKLNSNEEETKKLRRRNEFLEKQIQTMNETFAQCSSQIAELKPELSFVRTEIDQHKCYAVEQFEKITICLKKQLVSSANFASSSADDASPQANDDVVELSDANLHSNNIHCTVDDNNDNDRNNVVDGLDRITNV